MNAIFSKNSPFYWSYDLCPQIPSKLYLESNRFLFSVYRVQEPHDLVPNFHHSFHSCPSISNFKMTINFYKIIKIMINFPSN